MQKKIKNTLIQCVAFLVIAVSGHSYAANGDKLPPSNPSALPSMLIYIQPVEYTHPIRLWSPYQDYWYEQGPVVEALAMEKLSAIDNTIAMCDGNQSGKTLIWLQPKMFYNPQIQVFYGELVANVYTGMGKLVGTYKGKSQVRGRLTMQAPNSIKKAYAQAMDTILLNLQADANLQTILKHRDDGMRANATPCSMVTLLPTPTLRNMPF